MKPLLTEKIEYFLLAVFLLLAGMVLWGLLPVDVKAPTTMPLLSGALTTSAPEYENNATWFYGDFDHDNDVDQNDYAWFVACHNGPKKPYKAIGCENADFDGDADVDRLDFIRFSSCYNGLNPPQRDCPALVQRFFFGDLDHDGDVDQSDYEWFTACYNGPNNPPKQSNCKETDLDYDNDTDRLDFIQFASCFNGADTVPRTGCPLRGPTKKFK